MTMGELIEITTSAKHQRRFYRISSSCISFYIKRDVHPGSYFHECRPAVIGLAQRPGETCDYSIVLKPHQCWIEKDGSRLGNIKEVFNIFKENKYTKFWISWYNSQLKFGQTNDGVPLMSKGIPEQINIQYVTFDILADRGSLQWKLCLPPKIEAPPLKMFKGGELHWVQWDGKLPDDAFIGGYGREILYVIRAKYQESIIPGTYALSDEMAVVPLLNRNQKVKDFEILCGYNCTWVKSCKDNIPIGAVEAGYDDVCKEKLYIGRVVVDDNLIPGKVQSSNTGCCVSYDMRQYYKYKYEILINLESKTDSPGHSLFSITDRLPEFCPQGHCEDNFEDQNHHYGQQGSSDSEG